MFGRTPKGVESKLDNVMDTVLNEMEYVTPKSEEYPALLSHLERVVQLRQSQDWKKRISPDSVIMVAGNLLGILVIVAYEQKHVMTSKGLNFVLKSRT